MSAKAEFLQLVSAGQPTGQVIGIQEYVIKVAGLENAVIGALVMFETGSLGMIKAIESELALVLHLTTDQLSVGTLVVLKSALLSIGVSEELIGRVINPLGTPMDSGGFITASDHVPLFAPAPAFTERGILDSQLESGVMVVDTLFPIVMGQRIAIMGDNKSGKTTFVTQLMINQVRQEKLVVYVMMDKRKSEIDLLISRLEQAKVRENVVIVTADIFDAVPMSYLAPYGGIAIAEYFWKRGRDVIIIYDDLSSHAKIYREISLQLRANPGRESYPGDMFYVHSSLLERAGKLESNQKTLTALPIAVTPGNDITGYLSTSLISITDGQLIFDLDEMRSGIKPAVSVGLSVSRVGGRTQNPRYKQVAGAIAQRLAAYHAAQDYAHFGSELSASTRHDLTVGDRIYQLFYQTPDELYPLAAQQLMLKVVLNTEQAEGQLNTSWLKQAALAAVKNAKQPEDLSALAETLEPQALLKGQP